jgi:hypothetical protein
VAGDVYGRQPRVAPDGLEAWKQVIERGYEGYVAKGEAGGYEGGATRRWEGEAEGLDRRGGPLASAGGSRGPPPGTNGLIAYLFSSPRQSAREAPRFCEAQRFYRRTGI